MPIAIGPQNADTLPGKDDSFERSQGIGSGAVVPGNEIKPEEFKKVLPATPLHPKLDRSPVQDGLVQGDEVTQGVVKPPSGN